MSWLSDTVKRNKGALNTIVDPIGLGYGDRIFGKEEEGPDYSQYDDEQAAAIAAEQAAYEDFINGGPARYEAGPNLRLDELSVGNPLEYQDYQVGDEIKYNTLSPQDLAKLGPTAFDGISVDPRLVNAELDALRSLEERANEGLTLQDQADMARLQNDVNRRTRGRQGAIQQSMAARGISGSGLDLVAQMQASQDATETEALASLEKAAQAQNNKRMAAVDAGNMASNQRGQAFREDAARAAARDAISRFNTSNQVAQQRDNLGIENQAIDQNWSRRNQVSDQNTGLANQAREANWGRENQVSDQNVGIRNSSAEQNWNRTNSTADRNASAQYDYRRDKMGAGVNQAQTGYDWSAERQNREMMRDQQEKQGFSDKLGAITGVAGAIAGGKFGGPEGVAAGYQAGKGIGGAIGNNAYDNGLRRKRRPGYAYGGKIPGEPVAAGDSPVNDTVPANLSPGEIVIPRSIANDPNEAKKFVEQANEQDAIQSLLKVMQHIQSKSKKG
jgi:hypothetical protein